MGFESGFSVPSVQESLQSRVPPLHPSNSQMPVGGGLSSHKNISSISKAESTPDTSELVRTLPQKYRRKPMSVEEMDYIQVSSTMLPIIFGF